MLKLLWMSGVALSLSLACLVAAADPPPRDPAMVTTGTANPNLVSFDDLMRGFMQKRHVPGGALAVVKNGRLVYARGYGWADVEHHVPVQPTSRFRIASLSKMFTAAAILTLVRQGKLGLDAPAFPRLHLQPHLEPGTKVDPRLWRITVRQLLQHTGGFDSAKSFDPMFRPAQIAEAVGVPAPANQKAIIRYMMGRPLDFEPGTRYAYSNFGYCVLGRVIEAVSGMLYGDYVQKYVLGPVGIKDMRLGRTALRQAAPREVHYYQPNDGDVPSVYPGQGTVPYCYGGFDLEAMDSHGGWIASAMDLARFAVNVDRLFPPALAAQMYARPKAPVGYEANGSPSPAYYGFGWEVRPIGTPGAANRWHTGSLPGTYTLLVRRFDGLTWVVLFNERSEGDTPSDDDIDPALHRAADAVKVWPKGDLFRRK